MCRQIYFQGEYLMSDRIALQLYTVREQAEKDYEKTIRAVADIGYRAVETAGFPGSSPQAAARLFKELGLTVVAAHTMPPIGDAKNQVLEAMEALGKPALVCPYVSPDEVKTMDGIQRLCERMNEGYQVASENGMRFGVHNHWWEFLETDGRLVNDVMRELLDPAVFFEVDTYWVKVAGCDPAEVVRSLGKRAPLLHMKDGPGNKEQPMTGLGDGIMDFPAILEASGENAEWLIFEMDRCGTDVMEAVKKSYDYLTGMKV
jgi:sugar phosphate isomerase/epimerase